MCHWFRSDRLLMSGGPVIGSGQTWRYRRTARGTKPSRMPAHQAAESKNQWNTGPPWVRARTALTTTLTGWLLAKAWSHPGMRAGGTKAELAQISGMGVSSPVIWAVSGSLTVRPMVAETQQNTNPMAMTRASAPSAAIAPLLKRHPTRVPAATSTATAITLRVASAGVGA